MGGKIVGLTAPLVWSVAVEARGVPQWLKPKFNCWTLRHDQSRALPDLMTGGKSGLPRIGLTDGRCGHRG
ncbi:MAG: hypothetical protein JWQ87_1659 [Candidatus Sulfotelmatobacter sp.]|nr:hypothetical protein [Candidatus Sulfotelmatobacter sp.]